MFNDKVRKGKYFLISKQIVSQFLWFACLPPHTIKTKFIIISVVMTFLLLDVTSTNTIRKFEARSKMGNWWQKDAAHLTWWVIFPGSYYLACVIFRYIPYYILLLINTQTTIQLRDNHVIKQLLVERGTFCSVSCLRLRVSNQSWPDHA